MKKGCMVSHTFSRQTAMQNAWCSTVCKSMEGGAVCVSATNVPMVPQNVVKQRAMWRLMVSRMTR